MIYDRNHTASFTGHRTYRGEASEVLPGVLERLYSEDYRVFLSGMAVGFDLAAAEAVLSLRGQHTDVRLVCVVPFPGQERHFPLPDQERYRRLREWADETIVVCEAYHPGCYARRNDFLVDHASVLVAWYDGSAGGTRYTVRRGMRYGLQIENLGEDPQQKLPGLF